MHWLVWTSIALLVFAVYVYMRQCEGYAPPRDENTMPPFTESTGNQYETSNNSPYVEPTGNTIVDNQTQIYKDMGGLDFQLQSSNPILNFIQGDPSSNVMYGDFVPNESDGGSAKMYAYEDREMIIQETPGSVNNNCPRSIAIIQNKNFTPGTYPIDKNSYKMDIYPPLHVVATGPNNARQEMNYPTNESCPTVTHLVLDMEKVYDTLTISTDTGNKEALEPIPQNPTMSKQVYGIDVNGNIISAGSANVTTEKERNFLFAPDNGQYIPELTSPMVPFLGTTLSASELPASGTSQGEVQ